MAKKRITRKQLLKEPDEFITFSGKAIRLAVRYRFQVLSAVAALVLVLLVVTGIRYVSASAEQKAQTLLEKNLSRYESLLKEKGPKAAHEAVESDFSPIREKFSRTDAGRVSNLILANICYRAGSSEKAIALYNEALKGFSGRSAMEQLILSSLGYCYENIKDYQNAIIFFERAANTPGGILIDDALFQLGALYEKTGETEKSRKAFRTILSDHPDSMVLDLVQEKIRG